jgi:hypothetical protein
MNKAVEMQISVGFLVPDFLLPQIFLSIIAL